MCELKGSSLQGLLQECPNAFYSIENGSVKNHYITISYTKKLSAYAKYVKPDPRIAKRSGIADKHFCFSTVFEKDRFKQALFLVNTIKRKGGVYSQKIAKLDYFLPYGDNCMRSKNIMTVADGHIKVVTESQLLEILDIDPQLYDEVNTWSLGRIRSYGIPKPKKQHNAKKETKDVKENKKIDDKVAQC